MNAKRSDAAAGETGDVARCAPMGVDARAAASVLANAPTAAKDRALRAAAAALRASAQKILTANAADVADMRRTRAISAAMSDPRHARRGARRGNRPLS